MQDAVIKLPRQNGGVFEKFTSKTDRQMTTIENGKIVVVNEWGERFEGRVTKTGRVISPNKRHWYVLYLAHKRYTEEHGEK